MMLDGCWILFIAILAVILIALKIWLQPGMWSADGQVMRDKTVIVTGANTGIGLETAAELARYGAKVIMACRDPSRANAARNVILERLQGKDGQADIESRVIVEQLDLSSFESVRAFASRMQKLPRLDVLINNGAVFASNQRQLTKDGLELSMGTNHFGHFLLTNLLLPLLKKSAPSRIVVLSSVGHKQGHINFDDLNYDKSYSSFGAYCDSKLANILFARELAHRLEGTNVVVNSLHPGGVTTELWRNVPRHFLLILNALLPLLRLLMKTPLEGAQTSIYLAASQSPEVLDSGQYFSDCKVKSASAAAQDDAVAKKLWEVSEKLTKLA